MFNDFYLMKVKTHNFQFYFFLTSSENQEYFTLLSVPFIKIQCSALQYLVYLQYSTILIILIITYKLTLFCTIQYLLYLQFVTYNNRAATLPSKQRFDKRRKRQIYKVTYTRQVLKSLENFEFKRFSTLTNHAHGVSHVIVGTTGINSFKHFY